MLEWQLHAVSRVAAWRSLGRPQKAIHSVSRAHVTLTDGARADTQNDTQTILKSSPERPGWPAGWLDKFWGSQLWEPAGSQKVNLKLKKWEERDGHKHLLCGMPAKPKWKAIFLWIGEKKVNSWCQRARVTPRHAPIAARSPAKWFANSGTVVSWALLLNDPQKNESKGQAPIIPEINIFQLPQSVLPA